MKSKILGVVGAITLALPVSAFAYDFSAYVATTTTMANDIATSLFGSFLNLIGTIMPYAIGIFVLYVGIHWARRALSGR